MRPFSLASQWYPAGLKGRNLWVCPGQTPDILPKCRCKSGLLSGSPARDPQHQRREASAAPFSSCLCAGLWARPTNGTLRLNATQELCSTIELTALGPASPLLGLDFIRATTVSHFCFLFCLFFQSQQRYLLYHLIVFLRDIQLTQRKVSQLMIRLSELS